LLISIAALVVEADGGIHLEQQGYDQERDAHLRSLGLRVLRFSNRDIENELENVLGLILEACKAGK
jgi:very-short-patch-repair endonuclease